MTNKSDVFTRRILTFPAIHPSESVSLPSLVTSLINLAQSVCSYKSRKIVTNKRNARDSIRLIGNLVFFLEEIRNGQSEALSSVGLSLSELHFVLQKLLFLLEDCAREDARIWMLMKSDYVANQFQILIRSIAVALDVLQLESIDVSVEVKDLVEFVRRQALRAKFEVESDDNRILRSVLKILSFFEDGIVPDESEVKRVLEYLRIQRWTDCNKEVKFLDGEIGLLSAEKRDMGPLSSLLGFMRYCRCTIFDVVDAVGTQESNGQSSSKVFWCLNTDDFLCPISLEIMTDPVTIASGHTYDRASILKWFNAGNPTCPKTGERLICMDLVSNLALKRIIMQYCAENGIPLAKSCSQKRDIAKSGLSGSLAADQAAKMLANFLIERLANGSIQEQDKAAYEIRLLTKTSIFYRSCLVEAGVIPPLLNLLLSPDSITQENAIAALLNLSKYSKSKRIMIQNQGLELIIGVLIKGLNMEARQHAAGVLFYLASTEEYGVMIGKIPEAIPALMELIREGTDRGKKNALVATFGLLMCPDNHWRALAVGLVPLLVNMLTSFEKEGLVADVLAVLATLAEKLDGTMALLHSQAIPIIVDVLNSSTSRVARELCVSLLLSFCHSGGADVIPVLVKNPFLMGPLYSILTEGSSRASKKASSLIRILQEFSEKTSSGLWTPALPQEQSIHVW